jgi:hypothetical protein
MHGQQWYSAEGQVVDVEPARGHHEYNFTIEARKNDGALIRRTIKHKERAPYQVGTRLKIEISDNNNEIRFDPNYPGDAAVLSTMNMTDQIRDASAAFDGSAGPSFASVDGFTVGDPSQAGGASAILLDAFARLHGGPTAQVIGPDGQSLAVDSGEIVQLTQAATSGDPEARRAAIDRLHQIRDAARTQAGGSFSIGVQKVPVEERLARLQGLLSNGTLTQAEYDARRQQIISEI